MPTLLDCPTCQHPVPVTEANRATAVECPFCAREFTAYHELGDTPAAKKSKDAKSAKAKSKRRRDDDDDDDDGPKKPKRGAGGSGVLVIAVGAFGLLTVMAALGVTSYLIYSYDPDDYVTTSTSTSSNKPNTNSNTPSFRPGIQNTPNRPNTNVPNNNNNNPFPDNDPGNQPQFKPKPTTFELSPVPGPALAISPPTWLPALGPKEIVLPGKVDRVAVGGRGKYLVMHFKDRSQLAVFDISTGTIVASIAADPAELHLAAGSTKLVTLKHFRHELNIYSLPDLALQETVNAQSELFHPAVGVAIGSNTNGPVLVNNPFGEVRLLDISGKPKFIDGAKDTPTGNQAGMVRASADGKLFVCGNDRVASLMEKNKKWVAQSLGNGPLFPGPDGQTLYGEGRIINAADSRIIGPAAPPATWYVPAVHGNYFLKASGIKDTSQPPKHQVMLSIHANRDPVKVVGQIGVLDETAKLVEWWGNDAKFPPLDQHLFLVPDAKMLLVIPASKDRIIARRVDLKNLDWNQ